MALLDDPDRLTTLRQSQLLDGPAEAAFDDVVRLVNDRLSAPVAIVSLVDAHRQFFVSAVGLNEPWASRRGTPLSHSFCQHVVLREQPFVVDDARQEPAVADNLAITELGVVAYLGVPLMLRRTVMGALCAIDHVPRLWSSADVAALQDLASLVARDVERRMTVAAVCAGGEVGG